MSRVNRSIPDARLSDAKTAAVFADALFALNPVPMVVYDAETFHIVAANDAMTAEYGYARDELLAMTVIDLHPAEERARARAWFADQDGSRAFHRLDHEWVHAKRDGTRIEVEVLVTTRLVYDERPANLALVFDVTERNRRTEHIHAQRATIDAERERLRALAFTNATTGLPNFAALSERAVPVPDAIAAVLMVQTTWITAASQRTHESRTDNAHKFAGMLRRLVPPDALLLSQSDDVFAIVMPRTARFRVPVPLAKRIVGTFSRPLVIGNDEAVVRPTIGIAMASDANQGVLDVARKADAALEHAKHVEEQIAVYTPELAAAYDRRITIEQQLGHAIHDGRIGVVYQPILSLRTKRIVAAEALLRWDCPGIGPVPPNEFIAIAEESGAIIALGEWIMREACAQHARWRRAGLRHIRMAINVSARQLQQRDFLRMVTTTCDRVQTAPSALELELTESTLAKRDGPAIRNLDALRRTGVRIAVDDFGTGYSALSYLAALPLDTIKLDRSLVEPIVHDEFQAEIVRSVIGLAHRRGLCVVGEGVELSEQADRLHAMKCDEVQGFHYGRPIPPAEFATVLRA